MRDFRRQDNDIKDKADEIITKLKRLELPAMSSAQLNQYARELEQEVWKLPERANLREQNQRERDWLMTRVLDVQEHVQQQESDGANWRDLTSAGRKLSRSIELIVDRSRPPEQRVERMNLRAMNPVQLDLYTRMLEKQLPEGTNLGEQNRRGLERLEKKAWQLGKEIRQRQNGLVAMPPLDIYLASILRDIADRIIQSTDNHLSKLEERKLGAMSSAELNQYAQILEQEAQQLSDRTNRGQREPRKLEKLQKKAQLLKNEVTQRLESEQDRIGRINLASAGRKASRSIELIMGRNR
jgi:succinate dehydrogenase flavin-adding protein (antitoxin of CptAB toxin-antitoxin module)